MMELLERVSEMGITVLVVTHEHDWCAASTAAPSP